MRAGTMYLWSAAESPVKVAVAGPATECFLMSPQVPSSGVQLCADACSGVSVGKALVSAMQRESISPTWGGSPRTDKCRAGEPSENSTSTCQLDAAVLASCQRNVGGTISRGKIDPSSG